MLDKESREKLKDRLRGTIQKASSNVTTEVKAEQGDFKVILSSKDIQHFYKNHNVASLKVAELDDELISYIQQDPEEVATMMLGEFIAGFNTNTFEKTAANSTQNEQTYQRTTEKQLDAQKVSLHPRDGETYQNITEKQLPENNERFGTYETTTEKQLADNKTTFKGEPLTAAQRKEEDRKVITEAQFNDEDEQASVDRGDTGAQFNGEQTQMITEKQVSELLAHHGWDEPRTITEGKDQLPKQTGELARLTASDASKIMKEAFNALGKTVVALGVTPEEVQETIGNLTSHHNKEKAIASVLASGKQDISDINTAIKRAKFHGKIASEKNTNMHIASAILRQLSNINADPRHLAALLYTVASANVSDKIKKASDEVINSEEVSEIKDDSPKSIFASILDGVSEETNKYNTAGSAETDGLYQYSGKILEIKEDPDNREKFAEKAFNYSKTIVASKSPSVDVNNLVPVSIEVNQEKGLFDLVMQDISAINSDQLTARASRRRELAKEAQMPAGGMPPAGGADMMGGAGTAPPPAPGADMAAPPTEALGPEPGGLPDTGDDATSGEPNPPGTKCPACGSDDVDVDGGEIHCNKCGAEGDIEINLHMKKWPGTIEETEKAEEIEESEAGFELGGNEDQAGLEPGTTPPNIPVAASIHLKPKTLEKLASAGIKLGHICPNCGGHNCDLVGRDGICYNCNTEYKVALYANKKKPSDKIARFEWTPTVSADQEECTSCNRFKAAFRTALKDYGMSFEEFHNLDSWKQKGDTILKMNRAGVLKNVLSQYKNGISLEKMASGVPAKWQGYENVEAFPMQSCVERLNRRFGENASAMSGPCQGKKLAECVCKQLGSLGVYTDGLAAKVANVHLSNDPEEQFPSEECIASMKNEGFRFKESGLICDCLKAAYASYEDLIIEAASNVDVMSKKAQFQMAPVAPKTPKALPEEMEDIDSPEVSPVEDEEVPSELDFAEESESPDISLDSEVGGVEEGISDVETGAGEIEEGLGGLEEDIGVEEGLGGMEPGGDMVDITLSLDKGTAEQIYQAIDEAINNTGMEGMDEGMGSDMSEGLGDEGLEGPAEEGLEGLGEESLHDESTETPMEESAESPEMQSAEEEAGEEIPGHLPNSEEIATGGEMAKEGDEGKPCGMSALPMEKEVPSSSGCECPCSCGSESKEPTEKKESSEPKEKSEESDKSESEESEKSESEKEASRIDDILLKMKKGTITKESAGLSNLIDSLLKQAEKDPEKFKYIGEKTKKVTKNPSQESVDFKYQAGGKIGGEDAFSAAKPDVPRKKQLLGTEGEEMGVNDESDVPSIPAGSAAMKGEEHYRPEKQNEVDSNQGGIAMVASTKAYRVAKDHKMFNGLKKAYASGNKEVTLNDGQSYKVSVASDKKAFVLTAKFEMCKGCNKPNFACTCDDKGPKDGKKDNKKDEKNKKDAGTSKKISKESQSKVNKVDSVGEDPDINQSTGPGAGKIKDDKPHSLSVTEQAPSEGVSKPDVPKAPNQGRLEREEIVSNELSTPTIPAGGGMNSTYDQNEKNKPEKQEQVTGIDHSGLATANMKADIVKEATRIAGEMLRKGKINSNELSDQISHLSQLSMPLLKQYEYDLLKKADTNKEAGLDKKASVDAVETALVIPPTVKANSGNELVDQIQSMMTLNARNKEYLRISDTNGNLDVFK